MTCSATAFLKCSLWSAKNTFCGSASGPDYLQARLQKSQCNRSVSELLCTNIFTRSNCAVDGHCIHTVWQQFVEEPHVGAIFGWVVIFERSKLKLLEIKLFAFYSSSMSWFGALLWSNELCETEKQSATQSRGKTWSNVSIFPTFSKAFFSFIHLSNHLSSFLELLGRIPFYLLSFILRLRNWLGFSVNSRHSCVWNSKEISYFWTTQTSPSGVNN